MPDPRPGESRSDFLERCIPIVLEDGTAGNSSQAVAVCGSMFEAYQDRSAKQDDQALKLTNQRAQLRPASPDFPGEACGFCKFFGEPTSCAIVQGPVAADLVCDWIQSRDVDDAIKYEIADEDWLAFVAGMVEQQPYQHIVQDGALTPEGPLVMIEDTAEPKHRFSLSKTFHVDHTTLEHHWSQDTVDKLVAVGRAEGAVEILSTAAKQLAEPVNSRGFNTEMSLAMARQQPGGKFTKIDAGYMALAPGPAKVCGRCRFFLRLPGNDEFGMCEVVEGPIAPLGTSQLFIDAGQSAEYALADELPDQMDLVPADGEPAGSFHLDDEEEEDEYRSKEVEVAETDEALVEQIVEVLVTHSKQERPAKTVDGTRLFADDFASVGDRDAPLTWKLPLAKNPGTPDAERIAGAITAMSPGGFRGERVALTAPKDAVIRKISAAIGKLTDEDAQDRLRTRLDTLKSTKAGPSGEDVAEIFERMQEARPREKAGRRVRISKVQALKDLRSHFKKLLEELGKLVGWAEYEDRDKAPWIDEGLQSHRSAIKTFKAANGRTYLLTWTTNAFKDRDGEIFTTKAIEDLIRRNEGKQDKGTFRFWHIPGTDFADIEGQAMSGRFLVEWGPFHNGIIGKAFKAFFEDFPQSHATIAPDGWGSSHGFRYLPEDRKDGVYEWFDKHETSVLPSLMAANPYNPRQEVFKVDAKQRQALEQIGGKELADLVVTTGEALTKDLEDANIAYKEKDSFSTKLGHLVEEIEDDALRDQVRRIMTALGKNAGKSSNDNGDGPEDESAAGEGGEAEKLAIAAIDEELTALADDFDAAADVKAKLANLGRQLKLVAGRVGGDVGKKLRKIGDDIIKADKDAEGAKEPEAQKETEEGNMDKTEGEYVTREEVAEGFQVLGEAIAGFREQFAELQTSIDDKVGKSVEKTIESTPRASLKEIAALSVIGKKETQVDGRSAEAKDGPEETEAREIKSRTGIPFVDELLANEAGENERGSETRH